MGEPTTIAQILDEHRHREGALLPILNDVQAAFGEITEAAIRAIALALNLSRAEVYGVVSFYHDYRQTRSALPILKLCRAEACQANGVEALIAEAEARAAGRVIIESVYCLGLCSVGPAAMIGDKLVARLDAVSLGSLIEERA